MNKKKSNSRNLLKKETMYEKILIFLKTKKNKNSPKYEKYTRMEK